MKHFNLIISFIGIILITLLSLFILEFKKNINLKEKKNQKVAILKEAKRAKEMLEKVQEEISYLGLEAAEIEKMIPEKEKQPLELIRRLTALGNKYGLKKIEFIYKKRETHSVSQLLEKSNLSLPEQASLPQNVSSSLEKQNFSKSSLPEKESLFLKPINFQMNFECNFFSLLSFLEKINSLERIITIKKITIRREEKTLPLQKVSLSLTVYTFK